MSGASVDMAGALALATAQGVPAKVAAVLLQAFQLGLEQGLAERRVDHDQSER